MSSTSDTVPFTENDKQTNQPLSDYQTAPVLTIAVISVCEVLEVSLLIMVIASSWRDYQKSNRSCSILKFFKSLGPMRKCFLVAGTFTALSNTVFWIQAILPLRYNDTVCSTWVKITGRAAYSTPVATVYICLWVRQYLLYTSPVLRAAISKWFYLLSKSSLFLSVVAFLFPLALDFNFKEGFDWGPTSKYRDGFCYIVVPDDQVWFPTILSSISLVTQISYMILFYKTLKMHQRNNKNAESSSSNNRIKQLTERCFYFTLVTVFSSCLCLAATAYLYSKLPLPMIQIIAKVDLAINIVCLVFCFNKIPSFIKSIVYVLTCKQISMEHRIEDEPTSNQTATENV